MIIDRTQKPVSKGRIEFKIPQVETFVLSNGLKVFYLYKNTLPISRIVMLVHSGGRDDKHGFNGTAKLTSMLIDEGAGNLSGLEIDNEMELLGSVFGVDTTKEYTLLSLLSLNENIERSLEIFSLVLRKPNFNEEDFIREKEKLLTLILQHNDDPQYLASVEFKSVLFKNTPYEFSYLGYTETVNNISNNSIKEFHKNNFVPSNSSLIIVSGLGKEKVTELAEKHFENWEGNKIVKTLSIVLPETKKQIMVIDKPEASQTEIRLGYTTDSNRKKDFYETSVLNSILGGQFTSRINHNLREVKGYTYGAYSSFNYYVYGSFFAVSTSVKSENTADAVKEILSELESIKKDLKDDEIDFAKSYLIRRYPSVFETYSQLSSNAAVITLFDLELDYLNTYIHKISNVKKEHVVKAAQRNLRNDKTVAVLVGDKKKIISRLSMLKDFEIIVKENQ